MNSEQTARTAIFLHIPKTAGTTLHTILTRQYPENTLVHLRGNPHIDSAIEQFKQLPDDQKAKIRLLTGHFEYGIHQYLPQPATYFTLLRDPVERVMSYYYFILRTPEHPRYEEMTRNKIGIKTFVNEILTDNNQTRMVAGAWMSSEQPCTEATLQKAKAHIRAHFALVGLTSEFDTSLFLLKKRLGWQSIPTYDKRNVASNRPKRQTLTDLERAAIYETHAFDVALYQYVQAQFAQIVYQNRLSLLMHRLGSPIRPMIKEFCKVSIREFIRRQIL